MQDHVPHPCVDFAERMGSNSAELILENDMRNVGFIRNLGERLYLCLLKQFLTGPAGKGVKHFNFEKNFYSLALNAEKDFAILIDIVEMNEHIEVLKIGNNLIPPSLMPKLAEALAKHTNLVELSLRMHWPDFACSAENVPFIPMLTSVIVRLYKLEKIDLSYNQINLEGLIALANACEHQETLLEIDLSGVTYMNVSPQTARLYWLRIQTALANNRALLEAMRNVQTPPEYKPKKRKLIVDSDEELEPPKKVEKTMPATFFHHRAENKKTFAQRLKDIGISISEENVFGVKAIELIYYEQVEDKLYRKFMEEPHALFYKYGQHTYQRTYDKDYITRWAKQKKYDPFTQRSFSEYLIEPDPFYKEWIEGFVTELENDYQQIKAKAVYY